MKDHLVDLSDEELSSEDSSIYARPGIIRRRQLLPDADSESDIDSENSVDNTTTEWLNPRENTARIKSFESSTGVKSDISLSMACGKPREFYMLLVTDDIFENIAVETNRYAHQVIQEKNLKPSSRLQAWTETNKDEIKKFFGLIIWMGIVKLPTISLYWSQDILFRQTFPASVMSRNRFEIMLKMLHFANNATAEDRLSKIRYIVDTLNTNFKKHYDPHETICIDESLIPFRGRIGIRQFMKHKIYIHLYS